MKTIRRLWELLLKVLRFLAMLWSKRRQFNKWMEKRYTPGFLALIGTGVCLVAAIAALMVHPCLGMANDSIGDRKTREYGLEYRVSDRGEDPEKFASNEYFTREYEITRGGEPINSSQNLVVRAAIGLDTLFTSDNFFDVRFLALIYLVLYLPAVYLILKAGLERVSYFSEAVVIAVLGVIIFSDVSYLVFFNSLYNDALIFLNLLYIAGASMSMHIEKPSQLWMQLVIFAAGLALCLLEKRFFLAGILVAVLLASHVRVLVGSARLVAGGLAAILIGASVFGFYWSGEEFDDISKVHAVTRGILLESQTPDKDLMDMGIDPSYSLLTDQSLYDYLPPSEISNPVLHQGFLDKYNTLDIALYYLKHPNALVFMWNNGVRSALSLRRDYCGNYERSTGMPPMAKSVFWSMWSMFRERSLPNTIGYLVLLVTVFTVMSGGKVFNRRAIQRWDYIYFTTMLTMTVIGMADMTAVICRSGDSQLVQFSMTLGVVLDILFYYMIAEILHKLNILEGQNEEA